ncbi:MAG: zinc-dependent alcohol dehydrogenase family protein [Rhodospirillaceae bacterium]
MNVIELKTTGGPDVLRLAQRPLPEPLPYEVRVRAQAIGISSADTLVRKGVYKWMPPLPAIPGNEMAGVVDALGSAVTTVKRGQKVLVSSRELAFRGGCYAEAICVPADATYELPEAVSPHDAVTLPNYQLAGALLYHSGVRRPETILIHGGAGGVATALVQLCLADGIRPIATVSSDEKHAYAVTAGAPHVIHRAKQDVADEVMALTGGRGVDVVYAIVGPGFTKNLDLLAPLGTLVSINSLGREPDADLYAELRRCLGKSLGVRLYSIHTLDKDHERRRALMYRAIELMAAGHLQPPQPTCLPLRDAARAHEMLEAGTALGKLVLVP